MISRQATKARETARKKKGQKGAGQFGAQEHARPAAAASEYVPYTLNDLVEFTDSVMLTNLRDDFGAEDWEIDALQKMVDSREQRLVEGFFDSPSPLVRVGVAIHSHTSPIMLERLCTDDSAVVRLAAEQKLNAWGLDRFDGLAREACLDVVRQDALHHVLSDDWPTLETRGSDHLDFHSISVWSARRALRLAYEAGRRNGSDGTVSPQTGPVGKLRDGDDWYDRTVDPDIVVGGPTRDGQLEQIARDRLGFDTLETRNMDDLDFYDDTPVWRMRDALDAAYHAGAQGAAAKIS